MKNRVSISIVITLLSAAAVYAAGNHAQSGANLGNVRGGDFSQAHSIIQKNCTRCHSADKIDAALTSGKDMFKIQKEMEKRGANLNSNEQEVLGIYWKHPNPLKQ